MKQVREELKDLNNEEIYIQMKNEVSTQVLHEIMGYTFWDFMNEIKYLNFSFYHEKLEKKQ